ncbi:LLM class flavin-dependent oxidoreductase [Nocardioides sp. W3-2-3]|uniref:LLM class flavin-dependent oxidoreductase n=1 Tax=Nocardioides convexus TaxID=2712224 RepID=UPI0024189037|nr:LLM class flavin-dependent oxidoreductase [Nocardioides convexus]NHA00374.1 LLM class flavin-dependent oxidoreductase [Nocardioides convexus]
MSDARASPSLEAYVRCVRALLHDGKAHWRGQEPGPRTGAHRPPRDPGFAAHGPRALALAARLADAAVVGIGFDAASVERVHEVVAQAPRPDDLPPLDLWWNAGGIVVDQDEERALARAGWLVVWAAHHLVNGRAGLDSVPARLRAGVRDLARSYDLDRHGMQSESVEAALPGCRPCLRRLGPPGRALPGGRHTGPGRCPAGRPAGARRRPGAHRPGGLAARRRARGHGAGGLNSPDQVAWSMRSLATRTCELGSDGRLQPADVDEQGARHRGASYDALGSHRGPQEVVARTRRAGHLCDESRRPGRGRATAPPAQ